LQNAGCSIALIFKGGKSGQHRAPYFLTGRYLKGYSSVTENNRHDQLTASGKG